MTQEQHEEAGILLEKRDDQIRLAEFKYESMNGFAAANVAGFRDTLVDEAQAAQSAASGYDFEYKKLILKYL